MAVHSDGGDVAVGCLVHNVDDVAALEGEVGCAFDAWERDGEEFDGLVGTGAFHKQYIGFSLIVGFGIGQQFAEGWVASYVEAAGVIDTSVNVHIGVDGFVDGFDADDVAIDKGYFGFAAGDVGQVPFEELFFAVDEALHLDEFWINVHGETAGVFDEVGDGFGLEHFVAHGAFDGAFDGDDAFNDGHEDDVVFLQVEVELDGGVAHEFVEVDGFAGGAADKLDGTDRSEIGDAAGCAQGVEGGVEGREGEAPRYFGFTEDVDQYGAGGDDGDGELVGTKQVGVGKGLFDDFAGLCQAKAFQKDAGIAGGLDGAVGCDALLYVGLGGAKDGDVHFVAFTQYVGVGGLGTVGGAEHVEGMVGKYGVAIDGGYCFGGFGLGDALRGFGSGFFGGGEGDAGGGDDAWGSGCGCSGCGGGSLCGGAAYVYYDCGAFFLFGFEFIEGGGDPGLVIGVFCRRNIVYIDAFLQKSSAYFCFGEAAFNEFALGHLHQGGALCVDGLDGGREGEGGEQDCEQKVLAAGGGFHINGWFFLLC